MAEVDTSFYKQPQVNPLDGIAKVVGVVGGLNQNKLFQQTYEARDKVGQAYSAATNPDGTVDEQKLRALIGQSGFGAGEATAQAIGNTTANFNLNKARNDYIVGVLGSATNNKNLSGKSAAGTLLDLSRNTGIPPHMIQPFIADILNEKNPEIVRQKLGNFQNQALGTQGAARTSVIDPQGAKKTVPLASLTGTDAPVELSPEEQSAATAAGTKGGGSLGDARVVSANLQNSTYGLKQAIRSLERLGPTGSGPGTKELNHLKSFLITSGAAKTLGIDPDKVTDYQTANKYLSDWARQSGNTSTIAHLEAAQESNPNMTLAQQTNLKVARNALALTRMKSIQQQQFEETGLPASKFPQWVAKTWTAKHDPVVYMFDEMSEKKRKEYVNSLSKAKQELFWLDLGRAEKAGVLDLDK